MRKLLGGLIVTASLLLGGCSNPVVYTIKGAEVVDKSAVPFPTHEYKGRVTILVEGSPYTYPTDTRSYDLVSKGSLVDVDVKEDGKAVFRPSFVGGKVDE